MEGRRGHQTQRGGPGVRQPGNRVARVPETRRDGEPCGFPPDLLGASGQISICMQDPEVVPDDALAHGTGEWFLKCQVEAQPGELSLEEGTQHSSQQPPAQLSHRPKRGPQLWPKMGE